MYSVTLFFSCDELAFYGNLCVPVLFKIKKKKKNFEHSLYSKAALLLGNRKGTFLFHFEMLTYKAITRIVLAFIKEVI